MNFEYFAQTDPGLIRENNEDSVALDEAAGLAVLADGMGGYNAGEVASAMATGTVSTALGTWLLTHQDKASARETAIAMRLSVERANQVIYQASLDNSEFTGMGTTLVVAVFAGARADYSVGLVAGDVGKAVGGGCGAQDGTRGVGRE